MELFAPDWVLSLLRVEGPHVDGGIPGRRHEASVVLEPRDGANRTDMGLKDVLGGVLCRVELVDVDEGGELAGEKMATIREYNLTALLDRQVFVLLN